jgi:hypothetical protein
MLAAGGRPAPGELFRIAAHEQNPGARIEIFQFSRQFAAVLPGHDDVGKQQIDRP